MRPSVPGAPVAGELGTHPKSQPAAPQAYRVDARASSKSSEPTSAMAVNLGSLICRWQGREGY